MGKIQTIQIESAARLCHQIARDMQIHAAPLSIRYILYRGEHRKESLDLAIQDLAPLVPSHLFRTFKNSIDDDEQSSILGTFVQSKNICLGVSSRVNYLAVCAINLDEATSLADIGRTALHFAWHLLDFMQRGDRDETSTSFYNAKSIYNHTPEKRALANMKADIFSVAALAFFKLGNVVRTLAKAQCDKILSPMSADISETFLFPIAAEVAEFAIGQVIAKPMSQKKIISESLAITKRVSKVLDENVGLWNEFLDSAQIMAWRGYSTSDIIESAILTSTNTKIRMIGHLVSDNVGIVIGKIPDDQNIHSSFAAESYNAILHYNSCARALADTLVTCIKNGNGDALRSLAKKQNSRLIDGQVMGWCAHALWSAANAFDHEKEVRQSEIVARDVFQREQSKTGWNDLNALGTWVITEKRQGHTPDKSAVVQFCGDNKSLAHISDALKHIGEFESILPKNHRHAPPDFKAMPSLSARPRTRPTGRTGHSVATH